MALERKEIRTVQIALAFVVLCSLAGAKVVHAVYSVYLGSWTGMANDLVKATIFTTVALLVSIAGGPIDLSAQLAVIVSWCGALPDRAMNVAAAFGLASLVIGLGMLAYAAVRPTPGNKPADTV